MGTNVVKKTSPPKSWARLRLRSPLVGSVENHPSMVLMDPTSDVLGLPSNWVIPVSPVTWFPEQTVQTTTDETFSRLFRSTF